MAKLVFLSKGKKRPIGYITPGGYKKTSKGWIKVGEKREKNSLTVLDHKVKGPFFAGITYREFAEKIKDYFFKTFRKPLTFTPASAGHGLGEFSLLVRYGEDDLSQIKDQLVADGSWSIQIQDRGKLRKMNLPIEVVEEVVKLSKSLFFKSRKLHYRTEFQGLPISVENKKGSIRHWFDPMKNEHGQTKMKYPYGYIRLTEGADGEHVDCYIGDDKNCKRVFVVHQNNPKNGRYDEDKVMLGFNNAAVAKRAYLMHYNDPKFFGSMSEFDIDTFKNKINRKRGKIK